MAAVIPHGFAVGNFCGGIMSEVQRAWSVALQDVYFLRGQPYAMSEMLMCNIRGKAFSVIIQGQCHDAGVKRLSSGKLC